MAPQTHFRSLPLRAAGVQATKASPSDVRRMNRSLIFNLLFPSTSRSRAELSRITGLSRVAVSDVVNGMIDERLIRENGHETNANGKGKRATLLAIDPMHLHVIAIDLSQEHLVEGCVCDLTGTPQTHLRVALDEGEHVDTQTVVHLIGSLREGLPPEVEVIGIGIAVPGVVSDGLIRESTMLGWRDVDLGSAVASRFGMPVTVMNDTLGETFTERFFGQAGPNLMFVKIDRGIAAATLIDDVPALGEHDAGGEIGHVSIDPMHGPECPCGKRGCLETLISAPAMRARMEGLDEDGRRSVKASAGATFATAMSMPVGLLDVSDICVYGPPDVIDDVFVEAAQATLDAATLSSFHSRTVIRRCRCGADITLRGTAVATVLRHLERA
ncbi:ROK family protein [Bifidobacterium aesculapii]|uniref:ROK family protein n=1 Tax=Bifidobacterium aesculapii TaxID=1329411 RepID=UPI0006E346EE|nr:ROK family protein [Bifidobacterium aesculapii]